MRNVVSTLVAVCLFLLVSGCASRDVDYVQVFVEVQRQGTPVFSPSVIALVGELTTVQMGADIDNGLKMAITATKYDEHAYLVKSTLSEGKDGHWTIVTSPSVTVLPGSTAMMMIGSTQERPDWTFSFDVVERTESWRQRCVKQPSSCFINE